MNLCFHVPIGMNQEIQHGIFGSFFYFDSPFSLTGKTIYLLPPGICFWRFHVETGNGHSVGSGGRCTLYIQRAYVSSVLCWVTGAREAAVST